MKRHDGRQPNQLRKIKVTKNYMKNAEGSCLIEFGETKVICTASVEEGVPPFLKGFRQRVGDCGIWHVAAFLHQPYPS